MWSRNHPNAPAYFGRIIRCWRDLLAWKCCQQIGSKPTQTGPNPSREPTSAVSVS